MFGGNSLKSYVSEKDLPVGAHSFLFRADTILEGI